MARHSFHPRNSLFPCFILYFPTLRALLQEISPFIIATLLFSHSENTFPIRVFPFFVLYPTFIFPLISFPPFIPPPSSLLPHFLSHSSPLFHLPPQLTHDRAHPRALRAYAYARTTRTSGGFRLLPSPLHHPSQSTVHQRIRGEGKREKAFTKMHNNLTINTLAQNTRFHPP